MYYNQVLDIINSRFGFISLIFGLRYATFSTKYLWSQYIFDLMNLNQLDKEINFRLNQTCKLEFSDG